MWQPRVLRWRCGSRGGCTEGVAAYRAAPQVWQPMVLERLHQGGGSRQGSTAVMAAKGAALRVWPPRVLRCRCGSREAAPQIGGQGSGLQAEAAEGAPLQVWQPFVAREAAPRVWQPTGQHCSDGSRGGCAATEAARGLHSTCRGMSTCAAGVAAEGAALWVQQVRGLHRECGSLQGCATGVTALGAQQLA